MTRYLKKCRIAALGGLASLVVLAFTAAPSGATVSTVCSGTPPYQTCHQFTTIHMSVKLAVSGHRVKVKITVTDPHLNLKLYKKKGTTYRFVRTVFNGNVSQGTHRFKFRVKKTGKYELKVRATVAATSTTAFESKTIKKFFRIT